MKAATSSNHQQFRACICTQLHTTSDRRFHGNHISAAPLNVLCTAQIFRDVNITAVTGIHSDVAQCLHMALPRGAPRPHRRCCLKYFGQNGGNRGS